MRRHLPQPLIERAFESIREVVDYYQRWFLQIDVSGQSRPEEPDREAKKLRALRDVMARYEAEPDLQMDLDSHEENLVVSCAIYSMEKVIEMKQQPGVRPEELEALNDSLRILYKVAMEFATNPVRVIERHDRTKPFPFDLRRVIEAINKRVHSNYEDAMPADGRPQGAAEPVNRVNVMSDQDCIAQWGEEQQRHLIPTDAGMPIHAPGMEAGACISVGDIDEDECPSIQSGAPAFGHMYEQGELDEVEEDEVDDEAAIDFDFGLLKEPRLVAMAECDLVTLQSARRSGDPKLIAKALSSILVIVLIDMALGRRHEMRLRGTPESWDMGKLLQQFLFDFSMEIELRSLMQLLSCQRILRPAATLVHPVEVDDSDLERMLDSLRRFLSRVAKSLLRSRV